MKILEKTWFKTFQIFILVAIDQWTKILAQRELQFAPPKVYLDGFFRLEYAENSGAFLSLGSKLPQEVRFWIFIVAVGAFLLGALYYLYFDKKLDRTSLFSLAIISGGGIGNLIDRIFRVNHGVVDFLNIGFGSVRTGIFNVADMAIMLGVILLFVKSLTAKSPVPNPQ